MARITVERRRINRYLVGLIVLVVTGLSTCLGTYHGDKISSWLIPWQPPGQPPERGARIAADEYGRPLVETAPGTVYRCSLESQSENCWVKVDRSTLAQSPHSCVPHLDFYVPRPPGWVISTVEFQQCEPGFLLVVGQYNFALLADGSVWRWYTSYAGPLSEIYYLQVGLVAGLIAGLLVGLVAGWVLIHRVIRSAPAEA